MSEISFRRVNATEPRIYDADGDHVGDVYAHDDILVPGRRVYLVLLEDDARGWVAVHDRARIREVAAERLLTHPFR